MLGEPIITDEGATFTPWTDGYAVGFKVTANGKPDRYIYLNPSSGNDLDDINETNVFLYLDSDASNVETVCYVDIWKD